MVIKVCKPVMIVEMHLGLVKGTAYSLNWIKYFKKSVTFLASGLEQSRLTSGIIIISVF